ncbi:hypothetical protein LEP1GSC047_0260 [Leptospira inadai serovar Lyme str. 10]|uniref:Phosphoribosylpyrophosphate synthetase n=2 Tax=Leptospira inadai serovar Lyme TaxID=293084 RepID=V6HT84_9LEPT|nr:hypothetical protein [Leptospira inadai]EQA35884.1 hypothetical protein LEP1GSC047_0260 [Leptospira inadai serovar Lyme str. 10]PNV76768.1 phosphoribosylpyrophosphate synthetase [Leptospira inadai serovar Lyme]
MHSYETISDAISGLKAEGYSEDFNLLWNMHRKDSEIYTSPQNFKVDKFYRFEGSTDPADEAILYAISSSESPHKGILVDGYGISADEGTGELVSRLMKKSG